MVVRWLLEDGDIECVLAQWEIADALYELDGFTLPTDHVAWPGHVVSADLTDAPGIVRRLGATYPEGSAAAFVVERIGLIENHLQKHWDSGPRPALAGELARRLDQAAANPGLSADFLQQVGERPRLPPLDKGGWMEYRAWPEPGVGELLPGQARRLNRLILESVFREELAGSRYLSTSALCRWMVSTLRSFEHWTVVAHPDHQPRCSEALRRAAAGAGHAPRIDLADCSRVGYDTRSAQTWTQSQESFHRYEQDLPRDKGPGGREHR